MTAVTTEFPVPRHHTVQHVRQYWSIREELSVDDGLVLFGRRIIIPRSARKNVLLKLHAAHQGIVWMKRRARQTVFWTGITNEITLVVEKCQACQERLPRQPQEPLLRDPLLSRVFEDVSANLFKVGSLHFLVYADRLSGWPVVHQWRHDPSAREVTQAVIDNFFDLGVPVRMRSDNGPQFDAPSFQSKLRQWGVVWGNSTPHYPQSNGHAEAAVAAMKDLVTKISLPLRGDLTSDDFASVMLEFRNTPRENGLSPAEMVFDHPLRSIVPAHQTSYATRWRAVMKGRDRQAELDAAVKFKYDEHARPLAPLPLGTDVRVRDPPSTLWDKVGVVVSIGRYRSYRNKFESGSVLWRNRRLLRPMVAIPDAGEPSPEADVQNTDSEGGGERSRVDHPMVAGSAGGDHPMAAGSAGGVSVPSPLPTDTGNTEDADVPKKQPLRRSQRARKRRVMFDV